MARLGLLKREFGSWATHTLYEPGLMAGMAVVDLGANHGAFRRELATRVPGARFYAVEANPQLAEKLEGYERVFSYAVTGGEQTARLHLAENDEASSLLELPEVSEVGATLTGMVEVPGRSMEAILDEIPGTLDVVKVDIEGAEIAALLSLSESTLRRIGQLTVEFHRHQVFGFDLEAATRQAISYVQQHGFLVFRFDTVDMDVLLLNRTWFGVRARCWHAIATLEPRISGARQRLRKSIRA